MSDTTAATATEATEKATVTQPDAAVVAENVPASDSTTPEEEIEYPSTTKLVLIMLALSLAVFLVALDQTIIAPALGAITSEYGTVRDIGWYGSAYLLTSTALQPLYGTVYRIFHIKYTFILAIFVFEVGSLICALAPNSVAFIVGRAIAGIGVAGLFSGAIVILSYTVPLRRRPAFFGIFGGIWGIASVAGPLLGGAFTDHATWRWCFYVNLPIGGAAIVCVFFLLHIPRVNNPDGASVIARILQLDLIGASILIPAIVMLLLALQWGGTTYPWSDSRIIGLFVGAAVSAVIFAGIEIWQGDKGLLPPRFFKNRDVLFSMIFAFFFGSSFFAMIYYLSLYFQAIQGDTAVQAGIKQLPLLISVVISSIVSGGLVTATGHYVPVIIVEMVLMTVGAGMISTLSIDSSLGHWFGFQVIMGLGTGIGFQAGVTVVQNVVSHELIPQGTACIQFFQILGGALFVAVAQTVFQNGIISGLQRDVPQLNPLIVLNTGANEIPQALAAMGMQDAIPAALEAYLQGLKNTYYVSTATAGAAFLAAWGLSWKKIKQTEEKPKTDVEEGREISENDTAAETEEKA